jgi:protein-disulfide isomerase
MASAQKPFYIAFGVIILAGAAFIITRASGPRNVSIPANVVVTAADTSGFRGYILGSPSAPVEITEYADFECPHCADFDQVQFPDINTRLIIPGKARLRYRDFPLDGPHKVSRVASHAAACADDQQHFWQVKDGIFRRQSDWAFQDNPMKVLTEIVRAAGVDVATWSACMESKKYAGRIQASLNEGTALGVNSKPSFLINGRIYTTTSSDEMVKLVDSLIAASPHSTAPVTKPVGGM